MCINLCWEWKGVCWASLEWWGSSKEHKDILRSEGGGELTPVMGPRSSGLTTFVTRRRLVGR